MKCSLRHGISIGFLCLLLFPATVLGDDETNIWQDLADLAAKRAPADPYDLSANAPNYVGAGIGPLDGARMLCLKKGEGGCDEKEWTAKQMTMLRRGQQRQWINIYGPMTGLMDTLRSGVNTDMLEAIMETSNFKINATQLLVESSVAGAVQASLNQGYSALNARYLAEEHFMKQLDANPATREIWLRIYTGCVANYIRKRATNTNNGNGVTVSMNTATTDEKTWIEAQSLCMNDVGAKASNDFNSIKAGSGFDMSKDPSHNAISGTGGSSENYKIKLSEYIFNNTDDYENGRQLGSKNIDKIREDFVKFMGDWEFELAGASTGGASFSKDLNFKYVQPKMDFDNWREKRENEVFKTIVGVLEEKCKFAPTSEKANDKANIFCTKENATKLEDLGKLGQQVNCGMVSMLWNIYKKTNPEITYPGPASSGSSTNGTLSCEIFSKNDLAALRKSDEPMREGMQRVAELSERVALGQAYLTIIFAIEMLDNLTTKHPGGFNYFVRSFADQLVANIVGGGDIYEAYRQNSRDIATLTEYLRNESSKSSGQGSKSLITGGDSSDVKNSDIPNTA